LADKPEGRSRHDLLEERLLTLSFQSDPTLLLAPEVAELVLNPLNKRILEELVKFLKTKRAFTNGDFGAVLPKELFDGFTKMVLSQNQELVDKPGELKKELDLVKKELKILGIKDNLKLLTLRMREFEKNGDKGKLLKAQNEFNRLAKILASLGATASSSIIFGE